MQIKTKLLMFGIITIIMLTTYHFLSSYLEYKNHLIQTRLQHSTQYQYLFENLLRDQCSFFSLGLIAILENKSLIKLFAEGKREELLNAIKNYYDIAKQHFFVEHLHFHLKPAVSFLRVHDPSQYGDDLSTFRSIVLETNKTLTPQRGLEIGINGLSLRVVYPVFYENKHLGSVEMTMQPLRLAQQLKDMFGVEYSISMKKQFFDQVTRFQAKKIEVYKGSQVFYEFSSPLSSEFMVQYQEDKSDYIFDDQLYTTYKIPLYDFTNQYIGDLLLIENIDHLQKVRWYKFLWDLILSIIIVTIIVSSLLWFITKSIHSPLKHITNIVEKISSGHLNQDIKDNRRQDELGRLIIAIRNMTFKFRSNLSHAQEIIEQITIVYAQLKQVSEQISYHGALQIENLEKITQSIVQLTNSIGESAVNANCIFKRIKETASLAQQGEHVMFSILLIMEKIVERLHFMAIEKGGQHSEFTPCTDETILAIRELTDNTQELFNYAKKIFSRILPEIEETARLIESIDRTCLMQSDNLNQIHHRLLQFENITHRNLVLFKELASATSMLDAHTQQLSRSMTYFVL